MENNNLGTIEAKLDEIRSIFEKKSRETEARKWLIIVVTAATTFLFSTAGQSFVTFYSHQQDRRLALAKLQMNTMLDTLKAGPRGTNEAANEFLADVKAFTVMPKNTLNELSRNFGENGSSVVECYNNLSKECLEQLSSTINAIRLTLGLHKVSPGEMISYMEKTGIILRLKKYYIEGAH